ncbi:hypothetical protein [Mycolicibacterium komossense]|uniref:Uncharacterized protein n=1 Tax=Mycolicibacterium komossense TaxID=1779 RepID=A0ABT3CMT4_9MYCO|nr:hypothetical protein [Mycolicibacterium komossense]MCV7230711.1 hypothetical protein [Mycolicibacterium komossense]
MSASRGCRLRPTGPLIAGDLRMLVKRMNELNLPDTADVEIRTPISGDRRAAQISVIDYTAAVAEDITEPPFDPEHDGTPDTGGNQYAGNTTAIRR